MNKYEKDKLIGSGTFGTVWLVKSRFSKISYVLKEVDLISLNKDDRKRAFSEVTVLSGCNHENIVRYKDCIIDHSIGRLYIIMEYADNGDLHSAIVKQNGIPFSESCIILWFIQICLALQYIHYQNILHRDLKPKNIFLTRNNTIKVGDFGISRFLKDDGDFATTSIGTPYYLSPEICQKMPYNHKSDMWALGCTLFELSALEHPFKAVNFVHLINMILKGKRRELPSWSSSLIQELIENLLNTDPTVRSSADEILDYPSLQPYLSKFLLSHNSRKNASILVSSRKISQDELYKSSKEYSTKRRTATTLIPQPSKKRMISPGKEESLKVDNLLVSSQKLPTSTHRKLSPSAGTTKKQYEITYIKPNTRDVKIKDSPQNKVIMNLTYIVSDKSDNTFSEKSQNNKNILTGAIDYGYQSVETNIYSSDEKTSTEQCWLTDQLPEECTKGSLPSGSRKIGSEFEDSKSFTQSKLNSTEISFTHCQHGQCHQCILNMLWKNRIRGCVEDSVNSKEYNKLKNKLLLVFQGDLFKKIYQSLLQDWEGSEISSSASINNFIKNLNYEQVQNLPLMMQLIQLDIHIKPKGSENVSLN